MSDDEKAAAAAWKEYWNQTHEGKTSEEIDANYDGFFSGFYRGRDYQRDKPIESRARDAAHKVLHNKGTSKAAKMKAGSALTQRVKK